MEVAINSFLADRRIFNGGAARASPDRDNMVCALYPLSGGTFDRYAFYPPALSRGILYPSSGGGSSVPGFSG